MTSNKPQASLSRIPRYTSYPIYPKWNNQLNNQALNEQLKTLKNIDLYIHIPYCAKPCFYCGCNKQVIRPGTQEKKYVEGLLREWKLYQNRAPQLHIRQLHFGGGTPTFLNAQLLDQILRTVLAEQKQCELSVEIDPRITNLEQIHTLQCYGLSRLSMGIQDLSEEVQRLINRIQPPEMIGELMQELRALKLKEINFDLIYGLPKQSLETIDKTLQYLDEMRPTSISLFSYAHIPQQFPLQKRLTDYLPSQDDKDLFYHYYKKQLRSLGYQQIGLDHFAQKDSELYRSYREGKMRRSFMGYTMQKASNLIGLGVSSISELEDCFYQNVKDIEQYYTLLTEGTIPFFYSHQKTSQDQVVALFVEQLMCFKKASLMPLKSLLGTDGFKQLEEGLRVEFQANQTARVAADQIEVLPDNELDLRRVCYFIDCEIQRLTA